MKFSFATSSLALVSLAIAGTESVVFTVKKVDGTPQGYLNLHSSDRRDTSYFVTGTQPQRFNYENGVVSIQKDGQVAKMGAESKLLAIGTQISPKTYTLVGDTLADDKFWLCSDSTVAHSSKNQKFLYTTSHEDAKKPHDKCDLVQIHKVICELSPDCQASLAQKWSNSTVTRTMTSFVTYCPEPTVVTLTTCVTDVCYPQAVTVTAATTISCEQCLVPATVAPAPTAGKASASGKAPTAAQSPATSSVPAGIISSGQLSGSKPTAAANAPSPIAMTAGAAKNVIGSMGALGLGALLLL